MSLDKVSMARRVLLGSGVVLLIWSFLPWNGGGGCVSTGFGKVCAGVSWNAWHGWGTAMGIFLIALLIWEGLLLLQVISPDALKLPELPVKPILISLAIGALTVLFGVIRVLQYGGTRKWEVWIALIIIVALAAGLFLRFQEEGGADAVK
jgi:hypothetical protein